MHAHNLLVRVVLRLANTINNHKHIRTPYAYYINAKINGVTVIVLYVLFVIVNEAHDDNTTSHLLTDPTHWPIYTYISANAVTAALIIIVI